MEPLVGIIIGSDSDLGVMSKTAEILTNWRSHMSLASSLHTGLRTECMNMQDRQEKEV